MIDLTRNGKFTGREAATVRERFASGEIQGTTVYEYTPSVGLITLDNGRFITATTARRMNQCFGTYSGDFRVFIRKEKMYLCSSGHVYRFINSIASINVDGTPIYGLKRVTA